MRNKIIAGFLMVFIFLGATAFAKQKADVLKRQLTASEIITKMKDQLELNQAQVEEIKSIIENYLAQEEQLRLEEKKQLSKVLTKEQMFTWNFLQNEQPSREKEKKKK